MWVFVDGRYWKFYETTQDPDIRFVTGRGGPEREPGTVIHGVIRLLRGSESGYVRTPETAIKAAS